MMAAERTPRQAEVLTLVQAGRNATQIARELGISRNAAYQHIGKLRKDGYLPPRGGDADEELSVDGAVEQFKAQLMSQVQRLDARERQLDDELARIRVERDRVKEHLAKVDA